MKRIRYTGAKIGSFSIHNAKWGNNNKNRENIVDDEEAAFLLEIPDFELVVDHNDPRADEVSNNRLYRWGVGYPIIEFKIYADPQMAIDSVERFTKEKLIPTKGSTIKFQRVHNAAWVLSETLSQNRIFGEMELFTSSDGTLLRIVAHHKDDALASGTLQHVANDMQKYFFELRLLERPTLKLTSSNSASKQTSKDENSMPSNTTATNKATSSTYTCFISYSQADEAFAAKLYADLKSHGVKVWRFAEDAKWGATVWGEITEHIQEHDKLIVICSENSLTSGPVSREMERALVREDAEYKNVLFPIRIDDYIFARDAQGKELWQHPRRADVLSKIVGDFRGWDADIAKYNNALDKLLNGLQA